MRIVNGVILIVVITVLVVFPEISRTQVIPDIVVTGSRVPIGFSYTTRDVTVIKREDIEEAQVNSVEKGTVPFFPLSLA